MTQAQRLAKHMDDLKAELKEWRDAAEQGARDLADIEDAFAKAQTWDECPIGPRNRWAEWTAPANTIRMVQALQKKFPKPTP